MKKDYVLEQVRSKMIEIVNKNQLMNEEVSVITKALSVQEAIGNPNRKDFPLMKGKEKLVQAEFKGYAGQAFTDMPGNFKGTIHQILHIPFDSNYNRSVFVATVNALMNYLGLCQHTIHCKDEEPEFCAKELVDHIKNNFGNPKISLIGYQPAFLEKLSAHFTVRVLDLDPDKIGTEKFGIGIEDGDTQFENVIKWCDLVLATGSTVVNSTLENTLNIDKPVIYYGTTIAGTACLLGLDRYCQYSK